MKKVLLLSLMAIVCHMMQAQEKILIDSIYYTINNGEATVCGFIPDANGEFRLNIPAYISKESKEYPVTVVGELNRGVLTSVNIPNTVKKLEDGVFYNTELSMDEFIIPESVDTMFYLFREQNKIKFKKLTILGNPIHHELYEWVMPGLFGTGMFAFSDIEEVYAPNLTVIAQKMFHLCQKLKKVYLPNLKVVHYWGFYFCPNLNLTIPKSVEIIDDESFYMTCRESGKITIPDPIPPFQKGSYMNCKSMSEYIHIPAEQKHVYACAFLGCSTVKNIQLDEGLLSIDSCAFYGLLDLKSIMIPSSIEKIGNRAFAKCQSLRNVYSLMKNPCVLYNKQFGYIDGGKNYYIPSDAKLYVPIGCTEAYKAAGWGEYFSEIIEMDEVSQRSAFAKSVTGVSTAVAPSKANAGYFNLQGQKLDTPQKGVNILRTKDGKARKVYVK